MGNLIHRGKGSFTHVENTIFFDHELSLKAKGIYCQIRSIENNPDWVFTIRGFASLAKDGVDSVTKGIKELEASGYIIRARKRSENGRFLKAEEATWITLDDPAMHASVTEELKADGFAILSEFTRQPSMRFETELGMDAPEATTDAPENAQVGTRTGKTVSGFSGSGETISGESSPINYLSDKQTDDDKPLSCPSDEDMGGQPEEKGCFVKFRKGEFEEPFERLCEMSLKPVSSLKFKRDAHAAWKKRLADGFEEQQILDAYKAYAKTYWMRNGDDRSLAKNLIRWLEGEGGLSAFADEPIPPDLLDTGGEPLSMEELAKADPDFAKLWDRVLVQRTVKRSFLAMGDAMPSESEVLAACEEDDYYQRLYAAAKERYNRYVKMFETFHADRE